MTLITDIPHEASPIAASPPPILVVDDEPGVRSLYRTVLARHDFPVQLASDGREALERMSSARFGAVVSDVNMPGCDGLTFLRKVRELDLDVPVILVTGNPTAEAAARAVEYGAFRYLAKPLTPVALVEVISRAVRFYDVARLKRRALALGGDEPPPLGDRAALEARFGLALRGLWIARQPIVSIGERRAYGYEALLRTAEPTMASPPAFLEAAERLGRLDDLGRQVRACAAAALPPGGALLFVNLHTRDLADEELFAKEAPLSRVAERVVLEITERASLDEVGDVVARVAKLRALGYRIAVDDLGAGYSGLASFNLLEPEVAKLDMSLVRDIGDLPRKRSIVRSLRQLCSELRIAFIAEGVETVRERDALVEIGCDLLQGYLFGKPQRELAAPVWT
jgi:EAL domain-containing protein (putative c-di-GMP-specific phosphodiesterase class I)/ActR/RegA family two-component response regulator